MVEQVPEAQTVDAAALSGVTPLVPGTQPALMPTQVLAGRGPGLLYRIEGELLPALHVALDGTKTMCCSGSSRKSKCGCGR